MQTLIIGSNRGIGLEFVKQLKQNGHHVTATCRSSSPELKEAADVVIEGVDLAKPDLEETLTLALSGKRFDRIIHNAGILRTSEEPKLEQLTEQFLVNAAVPVLLARRLTKYFKDSCKMFFITSRMGSIDDNGSGGAYGYRMSKCALNMGVKSLSKDFAAEENWSFILLHPGYVKTDMTGHQGTMTPEKSVRLMLQVMEKVGPENSGQFFHAEGQELPW